jgi:hypothetical protein
VGLGLQHMHIGGYNSAHNTLPFCFSYVRDRYFM